MIKLIENYEIRAHDYCYQLVKNTGRRDKNGNDVLTSCGYYKTVEGCIKGCYQDLCLKTTKDKVMELKEAIAEFDLIRSKLQAAIPNDFK